MNSITRKMVVINKLAVATLVLGLSAPMLVQACPEAEAKGHVCPDKMEKRLSHMTENLSLNEAQREQIKAILMSQSAEYEALKQKMKAFKKAQREAIKAVLTPEQQAKMEEMHSMKHGMNHDMKHGMNHDTKDGMNHDTKHKH